MNKTLTSKLVAGAVAGVSFSLAVFFVKKGVAEAKEAK